MLITHYVVNIIQSKLLQTKPAKMAKYKKVYTQLTLKSADPF